MARKKTAASIIRRLHRSVGAGAVVFIIFMVISGIALNHSNTMGLDQRHVSQPALLSWYGLDEPEQINSFAVGDEWLSVTGSQLYLNGKPVSHLSKGVGAVSNGDMLIAAGGDEMLLLDYSGNLVERLPWDLPANGPIESIGLLPENIVVVKTANSLWLADTLLLNWQSMEEIIPGPLWSTSKSAPEGITSSIEQHYRGEGPSLERVLLDLHSGRIFGPVGVLVYDLLALTLGFLAISGLVLWLRSFRNGKRNGKP